MCIRDSKKGIHKQGSFSRPPCGLSRLFLHYEHLEEKLPIVESTGIGAVVGSPESHPCEQHTGDHERQQTEPVAVQFGDQARGHGGSSGHDGHQLLAVAPAKRGTGCEDGVWISEARIRTSGESTHPPNDWLALPRYYDANAPDFPLPQQEKTSLNWRLRTVRFKYRRIRLSGQTSAHYDGPHP